MKETTTGTSPTVVYLACGYWPQARVGRWAAVLVHGVQREELVGICAGPSQHSTALQGICGVLDAVPKRCAVVLVTTNQHIAYAVQERFGGCGAQLTQLGAPIKNAQLWRDVAVRAAGLKLSAQWQPAAWAPPELRHAMRLAKVGDPATVAGLA